MGRGTGVGLLLFGIGLALNVALFTKNYDTPTEVADYLAGGAVIARLALLDPVTANPASRFEPDHPQG